MYPFYLMKKRFYPLLPDGQEVVAYRLRKKRLDFVFSLDEEESGTFSQSHAEEQIEIVSPVLSSGDRLSFSCDP